MQDRHNAKEYLKINFEISMTKEERFIHTEDTV